MASDAELSFGIDASGDTVSIRLSKAPHILVGGMTGAGKSTLIHNLIYQLISDRLTLISLHDPKRIEFSMYKGVPSLAHDPVFEESEIEGYIEWAAREMEARYWYSEKDPGRRWSRLVVIVDELANVILGSKTMEKTLVRIASMGRAAGIHLILATQRPSSDVITGLIRANVPTRVCLPVISKVESRIVLDAYGGEKLAGPGDALVRIPGVREPMKIRIPMINEDIITAALHRDVA